MNRQQALTTIGYRSARIITIIISAWIVQKIIIACIKKFRKKIKKTRSETLGQKKQRIRTITSLLINASKIIINLLALFLILIELGVNIVPLLTGVGILGLGIGMGAKTLVADLIAGFFILLENQFNVGDFIKVGGAEGKVVKISLRTITLKGKEGNFFIIPNSYIKLVEKVKKEA